MKTRSMLNAFRFFSLPNKEKSIFLRACYLLVYYRLQIKRRPIKSVFRKVELKTQQNIIQQASDVSARRISQLITTASNYIPRSTCLSTALAGKVLLTHYGYQPILHIGVAKDTEVGFEAHAWVTLGEEVLLCQLPDIGKYVKMPLEKLNPQ